MAWAGDHTLTFELGWNARNTKPSIATGLRLMNISVRSKDLYRFTGTQKIRRRHRAGRAGHQRPATRRAERALRAPEIDVPGGRIAEITRYSARTGQPELTFKPWVLIGRNYLWCDPLWTDGSGRHALAACGSPVHYLRVDGNRMRQVNLHLPLQELWPSTNAYFFAF